MVYMWESNFGEVQGISGEKREMNGGGEVVRWLPCAEQW